MLKAENNRGAVLSHVPLARLPLFFYRLVLSLLQTTERHGKRWALDGTIGA